MLFVMHNFELIGFQPMGNTWRHVTLDENLCRLLNDRADRRADFAQTLLDTSFEDSQPCGQVVSCCFGAALPGVGSLGGSLPRFFYGCVKQLANPELSYHTSTSSSSSSSTIAIYSVHLLAVETAYT